MVKASKGIWESTAAEPMLLAQGVPVPCCECGKQMVSVILNCSVCQGKFSESYLNAKANTVALTLVCICGEVNDYLDLRLFFLPVPFWPPALLLELTLLCFFL